MKLATFSTAMLAVSACNTQMEPSVNNEGFARPKATEAASDVLGNSLTGERQPGCDSFAVNDSVIRVALLRSLRLNRGWTIDTGAIRIAPGFLDGDCKTDAVIQYTLRCRDGDEAPRTETRLMALLNDGKALQRRTRPETEVLNYGAVDELRGISQGFVYIDSYLDNESEKQSIRLFLENDRLVPEEF